MNVFRSLLETEHGLEVYNISTRSSTKASGEIPPEVHGADKPLDPNLKPEHQSKSKLPSIIGAKTPTKSPTKTQTPKRSPRKSVTICEEPPEEIPITSYETDPLQDLEETLSDTPQVVTKPVSKLLPPTSPTTQMTPKRVLSSIPEGDNERENKIETLRRKYRKALNPSPMEGVDARNYLMLDGLLFKIIELEDGSLDTVLCIPTSQVHILLDTYHSSLIGGHSGITKCYQTISQRFYCPSLAENLRAYFTGCHICQMFKKGKNFQRPYQKRMNINTPAIKVILVSPTNHKSLQAEHGIKSLSGL